MLRHCRKERPVWPWLGVVLLAVLWGLWGLQGWEWVMVQVPTVVMQDPADTGPVGHRTCRRLKATTLGTQSVSGQVTSPAATSRHMSGVFSEP